MRNRDSNNNSTNIALRAQTLHTFTRDIRHDVLERLLLEQPIAPRKVRYSRGEKRVCQEVGYSAG